LESVLQTPKIILENIQGFSTLGRNLHENERHDLANALVCFGTVTHCIKDKGFEVDFIGLAPLASEWLRAMNDKVELQPWLQEQVRWGGESLEYFWQHSPDHNRHSKNAQTSPGPWDLAPMWRAALEAVELSKATAPSTAAGRKHPGL
jgi:hypothetical protein